MAAVAVTAVIVVEVGGVLGVGAGAGAGGERGGGLLVCRISGLEIRGFQ